MIPIYVAVDTASFTAATDLVQRVGNDAEIKLGLEFFTANGLAACQSIRNIGKRHKLFLDLKFHDIPATVAGAVKATLPIEPDFLTVHTSGGVEMMQAAVEAANEAPKLGLSRPKLLGVTVLTSLPSPPQDVLLKAQEAITAGLDGVVCSAHEIERVRQECGPKLFLMVPGIRHGEAHDQKRVATARAAMLAGANALVIGREVRNAADPQKALLDIKKSMTDS